MIFWISDDLDSPTILGHSVAFGNGIRCVVGALSLHVRLNLANNAADIELGKNYHRVDVGQRRHNLCTFVPRHHRTPFSLQRPHRIVGVDRYDEFATQRFRTLQIAHMPHMQQIKIRV